MQYISTGSLIIVIDIIHIIAMMIMNSVAFKKNNNEEEHIEQNQQKRQRNGLSFLYNSIKNILYAEKCRLQTLQSSHSIHVSLTPRPSLAHVSFFYTHRVDDLILFFFVQIKDVIPQCILCLRIDTKIHGFVFCIHHMFE